MVVDFDMLAIQVMPVRNNMLQHKMQMLEQKAFAEGRNSTAITKKDFCMGQIGNKKYSPKSKSPLYPSETHLGHSRAYGTIQTQQIFSE